MRAQLLNPKPAYGGKCFVDAMHNMSRAVVLSVGGATETPTSAAYFTKNEPVALANTLAKLVIASNLDGVDLDWEDNYQASNPVKAVRRVTQHTLTATARRA